MPDLTAVSPLADNYNKHVINQSGVGRELIIKMDKTNMTDADVKAVYNQLTLTGGAGSDAFTWGGFGTADGTAFASGVTDILFARCQGTGTPDLSAVSGVTLTLEAVFTPAK